MRAMELVKLLTLEKSVRGAIKLVTALKLPNLAERFNNILEQRLLKEKSQTNAAAVAISEDNDANKTSGPIIASTSPQLSAPLLVKKAKAINDGPEDPGKSNGKKSEAKVTKRGASGLDLKPQRPTNLLSRSVNGLEKENEAQRQPPPPPPSNPFLKSKVK